MDRRLFLRGLTGIIVGAPAVVSASSLMKIVVPRQELILLDEFYGGEWLEEMFLRMPRQQTDRDFF